MKAIPRTLHKSHFLTALLAAAMLCAPMHVFAETSAAQLYRQAREAFQRNNLLEAEQLAKSALEKDSAHAPTRSLLYQISQKKPRGNAMLRVYSTMIIPEVRFEEATLESALEFLRQYAEKASGGAHVPNFVMVLPPEMKQKTFSLRLNSVPFIDTLRYVCELTETQYNIEQHGIRITPLGGVTTSSASAE
jgi:hypothetical protein